MTSDETTNDDDFTPDGSASDGLAPGGSAPDAGPLPAPGSAEFGDAEASFISEMGSLMERWGLPQATGRLFGYLLLRNKPVDLDTMTRELGQAKSGLSVAARQLEAWTLVRRSTRPGSRRIDYEAVGDLQHLLLVNNAHMRKFTETLNSGVPVARGEARDRLASLAGLFNGYVQQTEALVADWEARRAAAS
ncbi:MULTISPECIES: GbsR/MarR family transcriptional regulator [Streptomyces]|uniref:ArsR family transcriptional regulator n=1 Tax=Streptomyces violaceoruber TaxID=1935 RepID=A0A1V0UJ49_STRVN|nr:MULTISPECIES: ArsR family transcriptional regulator [Streptomyces]ARF65201.1 ArsR family transcriptional regulator [Streptomyces violaceoruber]KOU12136.1 ArsR family transcriptional regulator [Streptomyces sp. NRRL F-2295]KOU46323.1 ArsR family transcriptional regulator [Streptomyces sp. MMG1522]MBD3549603.1 ArsR family transcriptional regulator [Streptomyces sp. JV180]